MTKMIFMAAALAVGAGMAHADTLSEKIESDLESQGYKDIEISREDGQLKVEAVRGNQEVELVYDEDTGDLLSSDDERTTGLERAEQVSGKELPASGQNDPADDEDDRGQGRGSEDRGSDRNSDSAGSNGNGNGNGGENGNGRN